MQQNLVAGVDGALGDKLQEQDPTAHRSWDRACGTKWCAVDGMLAAARPDWFRPAFLPGLLAQKSILERANMLKL